MKFFNVLNRMRPQKYVTVTKPYHIHLIYSVDPNIYCACPENIHTPLTEGIGISWGFYKTPKFKEICEALLEFPEGWGGGGFLGKTIPSLGEVWIFSGTTHIYCIYNCTV